MTAAEPLDDAGKYRRHELQAFHSSLIAKQPVSPLVVFLL
jgi:hypothetical protein